jgi:hypothetical protein
MNRRHATAIKDNFVIGFSPPRGPDSYFLTGVDKPVEWDASASGKK